MFLKSLEVEFAQNTESVIKTFATGELCLENISQNPDVIILDYYLNSVVKNAINGIETLDRIKTTNSRIPVVLVLPFLRQLTYKVKLSEEGEY